MTGGFIDVLSCQSRVAHGDVWTIAGLDWKGREHHSRRKVVSSGDFQALFTPRGGCELTCAI